MTSVASSPDDLDTSRIKEWRSIVTLIVFVATSKPSSAQEQEHFADFLNLDIVVLWPFSVPIYIPKLLRDATLKVLSSTRVIAPRVENEHRRKAVHILGIPLVRFNFPLNLVTAPLAADLFLLAIL